MARIMKRHDDFTKIFGFRAAYVMDSNILVGLDFTLTLDTPMSPIAI